MPFGSQPQKIYKAQLKQCVVNFHSEPFSAIFMASPVHVPNIGPGSLLDLRKVL
ncbi:hypothetical protein AQ1_00399 [alpha proteobacterium Q-1]|nr:hypothetical protein AQ1_00399 [alpha proteobacterium Q-1]